MGVEAAGACDAVVFATCVGVLDASPDNCAAAWGLIEGEALMPLLDPGGAPVADTVSETPDDVRTFQLGTYKGSEAHPGAVKPPASGHGVCDSIVPLGAAPVPPTVGGADGAAVAGAAATDSDAAPAWRPGWEPDWRPVWELA
jgi:hypothetical protein